MLEESYIFPVSFAQQRLWFLDRIAPGNPFYNIPLAIPIRGGVDVRALERAFDAIIERHESLRTTFRVVDGEPCQVVSPALKLKVAVSDIRQLTPTERDARAIELATEEARRPFDLARGPLIRCGLVTCGPLEHVLLLSMHHIISDGWSMGILAKELTALYQAFLIGNRITLPELPIQYPDFAVWQRDWLKGDVLEKQLRYWRDQLADLPVLELPADRPRPPMLTYRGSFHNVALSSLVSASVRRFARQCNATPFMVLMAAFGSLLRRYSGHDDIAVGTAIANRNRAELEGLIGFFVNSLVIRIDFTGDPTFRQLVNQVRETSLESYAHQDVPFEKLVEELQPPRDPSRNPLFQVTFQLVNTPTLQHVSGSNGNAAFQVQRGSSIFDIAFTLLDSPSAFTGLFEYSTDLFEPATIARMDRHFQSLLENALTDPDRTLSSLPLLDAAERTEAQRLSEGPVAALPDPPFVHLLIAEQARRTPGAIAVQAGSIEVSYGALRSGWLRLARDLQALGIGRETRVGILMDRSAEMVTALLAVLEAGGVYLPLDPTYPHERLRYILEDSGAGIVLTHAPHEKLANELVNGGGSRRPPAHKNHTRVVSVDPQSGGIDYPDSSNRTDLSPGNLAYVLYTSGSTGRPKGVAIPHGALANHMEWMLARFPFSETDRVLQRTPYNFDASVWEFFAPLMSGARLVMLPPEAHKNPEQIVACIAESAITIIQFVPPLLRLVLDEPQIYTCTSLRLIFCGGEALSDDLRDKVKRSLGVDLVNLYGPTEATVDSTYYVCTDRPEPLGVPIGYPVSNTQAYVLDRDLRHTPIGVSGELYIAGTALGRGYSDRPALTAERFLPNPHGSIPGSRMYRTGDLVRRMADGRLLFLSRIDEQVKMRGFRIELGEVETLIMQTGGVRNCAVFAETVRGDAAALTALIVPAGEAGGDAVAIGAGDPGPAGRSDHDFSDLSNEHVSRWSQVYGQVYGNLNPDPREPTPNFVGWNSSYTGLPLGSDEMADWREQTIERVRRLNPSHVLENGCGTGLLLTRLAHGCERYVGTDFSKEVLGYLSAQISDLPALNGKVQLLHRTADDFEGIPAESFDTVILNSVVQYFPGPDYLIAVLRAAARTVRPGGAIFIGDVRSMPLLEAFRLSIALDRSAANPETAERGERKPDRAQLSGEELLRRVRLAVEHEEELVLDPRFFYALPQILTGIDAVQITLKRSGHSNELTRFRYDVVLRAGSGNVSSNAPGPRLNWSREQLTIDSIAALLDSEAPEKLVVENVPNARVLFETRLVDLIRQSPDHDLNELTRLARLEASTGMDPEAFWKLAETRSCHVRISFSEPRADCFDAVFVKDESEASPDRAQQAAQSSRLRSYANNPLSGSITRRLAARVRDRLSMQLPDYMIPSAFVLVNELPLLPNGKLDRKALPARRAFTSDDGEYVEPRTDVEEALAMIWTEVLQIERVGVTDDFFTDLGGHSLLATQLISRIRETFGSELPLKLVFQASTVEQFASALLDVPPSEREAIETAAALAVKLGKMSEADLDKALIGRKTAHA